MAEPTYAFSLPSIKDDLSLDCRIYHPSDLVSTILGQKVVKGAIIAHPYAPLGGCYDDAVVLSVAETLLDLGFIVGTFNFRGAQGSQGRTTWTGKAEQQDFISVVGFMLYYLIGLKDSDSTDGMTVETRASVDPFTTATNSDSSSIKQRSGNSSIQLLLTGYSYGSLILSRFPAILSIQTSFETAGRETPAGEIILRARTLASKTLKSINIPSRNNTHQSHQSTETSTTETPPNPLSPSSKPRLGTSAPVTLGGSDDEQGSRYTSKSRTRHHHRDRSGSSSDIVRRSLDAPMRLLHLRRHSSQESDSHNGNHNTEKHLSNNEPSRKTKPPWTKPQIDNGMSFKQFSPPEVHFHFLLISPVLIPFTNSILPPGAPSLSSAALGLFNRLRDGRSPHDNTANDNNNDLTNTADKVTQKVRSGPLPEFLHPTHHGTLVIFGSEDGFTSSRRLEVWAEELSARSSGIQRSVSSASPSSSPSPSVIVAVKGKKEVNEGEEGGKGSMLEWEKVEGAGHFWREKGAMRALRRRIVSWVRGWDE